MRRILIVNELGNEIAFEVEKLISEQGVVSVQYQILGPTSHTENTLTFLEARVLARLLHEETSLS